MKKLLLALIVIAGLTSCGMDQEWARPVVGENVVTKEVRTFSVSRHAVIEDTMTFKGEKWKVVAGKDMYQVITWDNGGIYDAK